MDGWLAVYGVVLSGLGTAVALARKNVSPRATVDDARGIAVLTFTASLRLVGTIAALVTVAALLMGLLDWPEPIAPSWRTGTLVLFGVIAGLGVLLALHMRKRVELSRDDVVVRRALRGKVSVPWSDVQEVTFRNGAFIMRASEGRSITVNSAMNGMKTLLAAMDAALPRKVYISSVGDYNAMKRNMPNA